MYIDKWNISPELGLKITTRNIWKNKIIYSEILSILIYECIHMIINYINRYTLDYFGFVWLARHNDSVTNHHPGKVYLNKIKVYCLHGVSFRVWMFRARRHPQYTCSEQVTSTSHEIGHPQFRTCVQFGCVISSISRKLLSLEIYHQNNLKKYHQLQLRNVMFMI